MNFSVYNADRATHLRIVVTALVVSIAISALALSVRSDQSLPAQPALNGETALKALASSEFRGGSATGIAIRWSAQIN